MTAVSFAVFSPLTFMEEPVLPRRTLYPLIAIILLTFSVNKAYADVVTMNNGDRLTGQVVALKDGSLHLETAYADQVLNLPWSEVAIIETDQPVTVKFSSEEVIKGRLFPGKKPGQLMISGEMITGGKVHMDNVQAINPPAEGAVSLDGSITLGGNRQSGNTDRNALSAAVDAVVQSRKHRFTLGLVTNYAEEEDQITERNTFGRLKYDFFFTKQVYGYLNNEFLYDRFKDLNLRTVVGPGFGYQVWDDDVKALAFEAGLAYYNEDRDEGEDQSWVTARLAARFAYTFAGGIEFRENLTLYPSLENGGEYTLRNEAAVTSPIAFGWALQLRSIIEHDSDPELETIEKTDYSWILGLNYEF